MPVSLNKEVDKIFIGLVMAMEALGPLTPQQQDMLQQGLEYAYKRGLERRRDSN